MIYVFNSEGENEKMIKNSYNIKRPILFKKYLQFEE